MDNKKTIFNICLVLIIIGALNWGLVALSPTNDLILSLFPNTLLIRNIIYAVIGISGIIASYIWLSYPTDICA